jgi:hypothetical protein
MLRLFIAIVFVLVAVSIVPTLGGGPPPAGSPRPGPTTGPATQPPPALQTLAPPLEQPDRPTLIRLVPSAKSATTRLLKYQLYPDALDVTPGNAATVWMRAGRAAAATKPKMLEEESKWLSADETPLADFPKDKARTFLGKYANTLRLADEAARKDHCDWELPPLTVQNLANYNLDEIQSCREIAQLLALQCRLEMSEGKFDQAIHTLQTGFALARHSSQGDTLIQSLVGLAISGIMLSRVEEMVQLPDAPNLYWALTTLPTPLIDLRPALNAELNTIYRSYPQLRKLDSPDLAPADMDKLATTVFADLAKCESGPESGTQAKLALTAVVLKTYPDAKRWFIAQGHKEDKVAALPALQVVLYYQLDQYNTIRDEMLAGFSLPPWQARPALDQVEKKLRNLRAEGVLNPFVSLLLPAVMKVQETDTRVQRTIALLRAAEALRWYAGAHDGKVPERWAELTDVPTVIDPLTGRGFDAFYQVRDLTAILDVPPMPHLPAAAGRRFELKAAR